MDWIELGYLGLFLATFLAATLIPFSSEITVISMLYFGFNPILVVVFATLGNTAGGMTTYYLGYLGKMRWLEKYFKIDRERLLRLQKKIQRYGGILSVFTWLPVVGDILSAALGLFKAHAIFVLIGMLVGRSARFIIVALFWKEFYEHFLP